MNVLPNILIVSVFQRGVNRNQNVDTHIQVMQTLKDTGIPYVELQGKYNGIEELSILIPGFEYRPVVEKLVKTFNQESYLESHNDRSTSLVYADGEREYIGKLVSVSKEEAERAGAYSYNPLVDAYYIAI